MVSSPFEAGLSIDRSAGGPKGIRRRLRLWVTHKARNEGMRMWDERKSIDSG
jgi:hypothetical protein